MTNLTRREAIKRSLVLLGGTLLLPDVLKAWESQEIDNQIFAIGDMQNELIANIAEHIIPTTDTPGARAAGVPDFIKKYLYDCYSEKDRKKVLQDLSDFDNAVNMESGKHFLALEHESQVNYLKLAQGEYFFKKLKELTILGYFTSEIGVTQALRYAPIPGKYEGVVPYKKGEKAWF